ncbi:DUF1761 domain-containing protein [Pseudohalocynthiibacter aestuariivivens]|jgi:Protein of unknown function (DUF1761)|uniref:DUF1761 domain-containing protein n=1 Tax=Pseudohalocynthiibacter aestuariivivens TaxID=1591409 RepID=A0ABV5JL24_9RHOB|nr:MULTISPECIES: DUF1761 domain-containing protein [Pseudohalocynthiibacter]MBS9717689.1 DUF1761 domain-containing protein [Pseudohalocynthiibacter aestuariivivens]MCK0102887.1 DUF1761 domain-containing protein [Pseudohalocynthiibacter sp. F2068]
MGFLSVVIAAIASYAFGAVWYMALAKPWMAAAGLRESEINRKDPKPYIISFVSALIVAGMMRHIFFISGIDTVGTGLMGGFGLGIFIVSPWILTNYAFSMRPRALTLIDGGYATFGCTIMGLVLVLV